MSKITVTTTSKNRISINSKKGGTLTVASQGITGAGAGAITQLRQMTDVDASVLVDQGTLVYDEVSDKFVLQSVPIINGGTF